MRKSIDLVSNHISCWMIRGNLSLLSLIALVGGVMMILGISASAAALNSQMLDQWGEVIYTATGKVTITRVKLSGLDNVITLDAAGQPLGSEVPLASSGDPLLKIHPRLRTRLQSLATGQSNRQTVIVWFNIPELAEAALFDDPAEGAAEGHQSYKQSSSGSSLRVAAIQEVNISRRSTLAESVQTALSDAISLAGIPEAHIKYQYRYAPAVAVSLTASECYALAADDSINYLFPEDTASKELDVLVPASKGPTAWDSGYDGSGVTIAHIEPDPGRMETDNPYLSARVFRTSGVVDSHSTAIGGIMASSHPQHRGIAPECTLLSANADSSSESHLNAATDWAVGQGASIINMSYRLNGSSDGALHWSDIYYDYLVHYTRVLFTKSAGNEGNGTGVVTSPGRGYNSLTVGNVQDNGTPDWDDDTMRSSSSYVDPETGTDKPEISAYGSSVDTTALSSPWIGNAGSGTSYAAPLAAGIAALCIDKNAGLADEPAALKAILMVSALAHNIEGSAKLSDIDGAGCVKATAVNAGYHARTISESDFDANGYFEIPVDISLVAGVTKRIVLAYTHPPSSKSASPDSSSYHRSDLDIYLMVDGTQVAASTHSSRNPYEIIDYTASLSGTGRLRLKKYSWDSDVSALRIGMAYASATSLGSGPDHGEDGYEDNDTMATAYRLSERKWLSDIEELGTQFDEDWYQINASPSGYERVVVTCRFAHAEGDIDIALIDSTGTTMASSSSVTDNETIDYVVPSDGTYYIKVHYDNEGNPYDLWWDDLQANRRPTEIALLDADVPENEPDYTMVGLLTTSDPDSGNTFTYELVSGSGDSGNHHFRIVNNILQAATVFDYETQSQYSVRIRTTDQGGLSIERSFTINITDVNEAPTAVSLSKQYIMENIPIGTDVGIFQTIDPEAPAGPFVYQLVSGVGDNDNDSYSISSGNRLLTAAVFDYEEDAEHSVRIRTTDQGGMWYEKAFALHVGDEDETPYMSGAEFEPTSQQLVLQWRSFSNNLYTVICRTNLISGVPIMTSNIVATPPYNSYTGITHDAEQKFWQIILEP